MLALEQSVSVIIRIVSWSPERRSFMIKSIAIVSKGQAFSAGVIGDRGGYDG